ncbi:MAG: dihydroorotase [Magnetovibrionaceae bacterium]
MTDGFDLLIRGGLCVLPSGIHAANVGIRDGKIAEIGCSAEAKAQQVIEAKGLHVLPGVIDTQVHFREPGNEHKEDLSTGTASAALGGVTAVFEMPNTNPLTDSAEALADKCRRAKDRVWTDIAFFMGATPENADRLSELERLPGCCGIKMFMGSSTGNLLVSEDADVARVCANGTRRMAIHCEDEHRLIERQPITEGASVHAHPEWRDPETAFRATRRLIGFARATKRRVHVLHVTTAEEMGFLKDHRDLATVEVTPQHLTLEAPDCYDRIGTRAQMNPPIRDRLHREALWRAIEQGLVDVIGSDHAPHTLEEKAKPYPKSPSGMPGVQTLVPLMLNHVNEGRLSLERFVDLVCHGPNRIYQIAGKGRITIGYDADFTLIDLKMRRTITDLWSATRSGWTPFDGMTVRGWPIMTVIRGNVVMREGQLEGEPQGTAVRFQECL